MARRANDLRPVKIKTGFIEAADGSALIDVGKTRVLCTASVADGVPEWRAGQGLGWVTAEYAMLPASVPNRKPRSVRDGRSLEIQRLVGRSLRAVVDMAALGERTIYVDCDVLQADGGTRTASITGGFVALALAVRNLLREGIIEKKAILQSVAAVSVGIVDGRLIADLDYKLDSRADVDFNIVMTADGKIVEIQGTAERRAFDRETLDGILKLSARLIRKLNRLQLEAIRKAAKRVRRKQ